MNGWSPKKTKHKRDGPRGNEGRLESKNTEGQTTRRLPISIIPELRSSKKALLQQEVPHHVVVRGWRGGRGWSWLHSQKALYGATHYSFFFYIFTAFLGGRACALKTTTTPATLSQILGQVA